MIKPLPDPNTPRWYTQCPAFMAEANHCASTLNAWNQSVSKELWLWNPEFNYIFFFPSVSLNLMVFTRKDIATFFFWMGRFSCAAITNSSNTFDFHGDRRIWDGSTIKQKLKGNSALYIIMNELPNGMCCVRTFVYVYDMFAKFSLLFLDI